MTWIPINGIWIGRKGGGAFSFLPAQAPSGLTLTVISDTEIQLDWTTNSAGLEDGFSIERSPDNATWVEIDTTLTGIVHYHDTTCAANTIYYYRVRAYKGTEYSPYCTAVRADTIIYLEDLYTTDLAAGNVNNTTSEDSGHIRTVVDTGSKLALSGGYLAITGGSGWGDPRIAYPIQANAQGMVFECVVRINALGQIRIGWRTAVYDYAAPNYIAIVSKVLVLAQLNGKTITYNVDYTLRIISTGQRVFFLVKGGLEYPNWESGNLHINLAGINEYPSITNNNATNVSITSLRIFQTDWDIYGKNYVRVNAAPWTLTAPSSSGFIEFMWRVITNETLDIAFRQSDATHRFIVRCSQAGSTVKLIKDNVGETELGSAAYTFTNTSEYHIGISVVGNAINISINNSVKIGITDAFNNTATGIIASGFTYGRDLIAHPYNYADADMDEVAAKRSYNVWACGDSIAGGTGDLTTNPQRGFPTLFCSLINALEIVPRKGLSAMSTATLKTTIDADLAATTGTPDYVLYEMGTNDSGTFNATWLTNTGYILDAIHTKWPNAKISCSVFWTAPQGLVPRAAHDVALTTVLSTRSAFASKGIDFFTVLENGDNGASLLTDGTHPNRSGYLKIAEAWQTLLGI